MSNVRRRNPMPPPRGADINTSQPTCGQLHRVHASGAPAGTGICSLDAATARGCSPWSPGPAGRHLQPKVLLECVEITVAVQQAEALRQASRRNDHIDGAANAHPRARSFRKFRADSTASSSPPNATWLSWASMRRASLKPRSSLNPRKTSARIKSPTTRLSIPRFFSND